MKEKKEKTTATSFIFDMVSIIATAIVAVCFVFVFAFRTIGVVGNSMYPTLLSGDRIILSAFDFAPKQGEIVVTGQPSKNERIATTLVKRVIAVEGQTVDIDFAKGIVYVDGEPLDEPYTYEPTHTREDFVGPVTVPEGYVFVMGDNRNNSTDSRSSYVGMIRTDYILGKAIFSISPENGFKMN